MDSNSNSNQSSDSTNKTVSKSMITYNKFIAAYLADKQRKTALMHAGITYAMLHGCCFRDSSRTEASSTSTNDNKTDDDDTKTDEVTRAVNAINKLPFTHAPFSLLPRITTEADYNSLCTLSVVFHKLVHAVEKDVDYLLQTIKKCAFADPGFTKKLYQIALKTAGSSKHKHAYKLQQNRAVILRSDYMQMQSNSNSDFNSNPNPNWFQIELNTISVAGSAFATKLNQLHKYLVTAHVLGGSKRDVGEVSFPEITCLERVVDVLAESVNLVYERDSKQEKEKEKYMIMVVCDNMNEHRLIIYDLWERYGVRCVRMTIQAIAQLLDTPQFVCDPKDGKLFINGHFISLVYYRAGYVERHYKTAADWRARELIETSVAIKLPSVAQQLIGSKYMQTVFKQTDFLSRYLDATEIETISKCFAGLWSLRDFMANKELAADIRLHPEKYVIKPQREGGGNNLFGEAIALFLDTEMDEHNIDAYIVMERIYPTRFKAVHVRDHQMTDVDCVAEVGIISTMISNVEVEDEVPVPHIGGCMIRNKLASSAEGGICIGVGFYDSLAFVK